MNRFIHLKRTPVIDRRYWAALLIASMCGANLGDTMPDILHLSPGVGLPVFAALFTILLIIARLYQKKSEAFYWLAILFVRAAATDVADFSAGVLHRNYTVAFAAFTVLFILAVVLRLRSGAGKLASDAIEADGSFWLTMLLAGISGTILADGIGHAFASMEIGVPAAALMATVYLIIAFALRSRGIWQPGLSYWIVVFGIRWWGTNVGDILAFVATLPVSIAITAASLIAVLTVRRDTAGKRSEVPSDSVNEPL